MSETMVEYITVNVPTEMAIDFVHSAPVTWGDLADIFEEAIENLEDSRNAVESPLEPSCDHDPTGRMTSGNLNGPGPHASTYVCDDPVCQADARAWAVGITGLPAEFYGFVD